MAKSFDIIYSDDHLIAVNKPSGWLSIPDRTGTSKDVLSFLRKTEGEIYTVHRIDRETSGVLIFARTASVHQMLNHMFLNRQMNKTYVSLMHGDLKDVVEVDAPLSMGANGKVKVTKQGKSAFSRFEPIYRFGKYTWAEAQIITGRTHQIRVHAAHIGHTLVADPLYSDGKHLFISDIKRRVTSPSERPLIARTALHAARLEFIHPMSKEKLRLEADNPKDLNAGLKQLKKWRSLINH